MHVGDLVSLKLGPRRGLLRATSAITHYERGLALEATDAVAAAASYRRAIASRPDLADAHNNLARLLHDAGHLADAEAAYRRAIQASGDTALYHFNLGVVLEDAGNAHGAIAAYERAIALDATLADAHYNLARQLEQLGRSSHDDLVLRRAIRHLQQYRSLSRTAG